VEPAC